MAKTDSEKKRFILAYSSRRIKFIITDMAYQQEWETERSHLNYIQEAEGGEELGQSCKLEAYPR